MKARDPFQVTLSDSQRTTLALWLSEQLDDALNAKATQDRDVDYWHMLYEQARTRSTKNLPWPDAADLTSYLACEKVDALHARAMRTIWTDPVCTVSAYGEAADRAPFIEEFHQWKAEEERLQSVLDTLWLISLIEPRGLVEIYEGSEWRTVRKRMQVKVQVDPLTGAMSFDEQGNIQFEKDEQDRYIEATDSSMPSA